MEYFEVPHAANRGTVERLCGVASDLLALCWRVLRLPVFTILVICEPVIRVCLTTLAVLGVCTSLVLEFSGAAPHFPLGGALLFFAGCGVLPLLYRAAIRLFAS
jgi:hypothetical protein